MASSTPPETAQDGPSLKLVFGSLAGLSLLLGVFVYWRYAQSEAYVAKGIDQMRARGEVALGVDAEVAAASRAIEGQLGLGNPAEPGEQRSAGGNVSSAPLGQERAGHDHE